MVSRKRRIVLGGLVVAHVVGVTLLAWLIKFDFESNVAESLFAALTQVQIGLLATWAGLSTVKWPSRLFGAMVGATWLMGLVAEVSDGHLWLSRWLLCVVAAVVPLLMILAVLAPVRFGGLTLCRSSSADAVKAVGRPQFSIRCLLVLTAAVAIALFIYDVTGRIHPYLPELLLFYTRFVPITLAAIWATLMARLSVWRFCAVVSSWLLVGFFPYPVLTIIRNWGDDILWQIPSAFFFVAPLATFLHTTILLASLLVVRRCGYRLVRTTTDGA
jgi:hypothetical protein